MNCIIFYPAVGDQIGCQEINMIFTLVPIVANIIVIIMIMRINIFFMYWLIFSGRELNQNPREASSRSRIFLSKSTWGEQPVIFFIFFNSLVYMSVGCMVCTEPPDQTENYTDPKFGKYTPLDHILFFQKSDLEGR